MEGQQMRESGRIEVSSSLVKAYLANITKAFILIGAVIGVFYFVLYIEGANPFVEMFEEIGIPYVWGQRAVMVFFGLILVLAFFKTLSLTSYELVFEGSTLTYSYGSFFNITKSTSVTDVVSINFKEYAPFKHGDIVVELTGTEENKIKVQYVNDAKEMCERINGMIKRKKSKHIEKTKETGAETDAETDVVTGAVE